MTEYYIKDLRRAAESPDLTPFTEEQVARLKATPDNESFLKEYKICIKEMKAEMRRKNMWKK